MSFDFTQIFDSWPNLHSAGKSTPEPPFTALMDSVRRDRKSEFVSRAKRVFLGQDPERERGDALKLLAACCGCDSVNCASSIFNGDIGSVPYINDAVEDTGLSPLHTAAEADSPRCVEMLLKRRARTDMRSKDGRALLPLELSLCSGSIDVSWDPSGGSLADLILLLSDKDLTVVRLLAEKTKDVDVVAHGYATAGEIVPLTALLIVAVNKIREATVALQDVDESVSTKPKTTIYEAVIQEALRSSNSQKRMLLLREIGLLQFFGAAVFSESVDKQTPPLFSIVQAGDEAVLELHINTDIDVNETDAEGNTVLHCCLKGSSVPHKQQTRIMNVLLVHGARITHKNKLGLSAVHLAAANGNLSALEILLAAYPELVHAKTVIKETPLFFAVKNNHLECVELLLKCGASSEIYNLRKQRPIELTQSQDIRFLLNPTNISGFSKEAEPAKGDNEETSFAGTTVPPWLKKFVKWLPRHVQDVSERYREINGYPLSSLKADFSAAFGMELNHASLGFPKLIDFIKYFPKLCRIECVLVGNSAVATHWVMLPSKCSQLKGRPQEPLIIKNNDSFFPNKPKYSSALALKSTQQAHDSQTLKTILNNDSLSPNKPKVSSVPDLMCSGRFIQQAHVSKTLEPEVEPQPPVAASYSNYHQVKDPVLETASHVSKTLNPEPSLDASYSYHHHQIKHPVLEALARIRNSTSIFFLREFDFYQSYETCLRKGMCFWCNKSMLLWANFPCRHKLWCSSCKHKIAQSAGDHHRCVICDGKVECFILSPPFGFDRHSLSSGLPNDAEIASWFLEYLI
ncbi:Serine/threonine-protein phosphatase 6 regulatory ankyrin repeat subunit [Hirschfeldia incana]|nr:Serine/threonine-protein phosphatase 6 regulatory ankyrin repeat subunit [Hirschfeldia incana]